MSKKEAYLLAIIKPAVVLLVVLVSIFIGHLAQLVVYNDVFNIILCLAGIAFSIPALRLANLSYQKLLTVLLILTFLYLAVVAVVRIILSGVGSMG